jgi:hypothetical protein
MQIFIVHIHVKPEFVESFKVVCYLNLKTGQFKAEKWTPSEELLEKD